MGLCSLRGKSLRKSRLAGSKAECEHHRLTQTRFLLPGSHTGRASCGQGFQRVVGVNQVSEVCLTHSTLGLQHAGLCPNCLPGICPS